MGAMGIINIILLIGAGYYAYTNDLFTKNTITNPLDQFLVKNNTPSSTIIQTNSIVGYGKPWQYYSCMNDESCKISFGAGTFCNQTLGTCYSIK